MKLKTWLKKNGESFRSFGKRTGIDHTSLFKYTTGERTPRLNVALKIEKATKGQVTCADLAGK